MTTMDKYDRQNRTYGSDATIKLNQSSVIVIGLSGIANETCKNLILSGIQNIILIEDKVIDQNDLQTGFYYQTNDIGSLRHVVLKERLLHLNPTCNITTVPFDKVEWDNKVAILHNSNIDEATVINNLIRSFNCKFIWVHSKGVSGFVFVDALDNHLVTDLTGELIDPVQIESISSDGVVSCAQHNVHDFESNDIINFSNLEGENLDFLNKEWKIDVVNKKKFKLLEFPVGSDFNFINGTVTMIKQPLTISHQSLVEQIKTPSINGFNVDFDKLVIDMYNQMSTNIDSEFKLPLDSWSDEMNQLVSTFEDKDIKKLVRSCNIELMPVISYLCSVAAMEAIKLITHKFTPIDQFLVYSDSTVIPDEKPDIIESSGLGNLFGSLVKDKLESSDWLMVGCGAIGCEMLKNLSKLNIACNGGSLTITDPDHIEPSNLSRQFLFRNEHIKMSKSQVATESILNMNPKMKIKPLQDKMSSENQDLTDMLFPNLFGVINALDNINARKYIDEQCFRYTKPLFESGTQGMKGNTQPVIPFVTETYSNSTDPPEEKSFPACTLKSFPNQPVHTVHWAMDYFEMFKRGPENVNNYKKRGNEFLESLSGYDRSVAQKDINCYTLNYDLEDWRNCSIWASDLMLQLYRDQIVQLLHSFPRDYLDSNGELFWSKGKRCPTPISYDLDNSNVVDFLEATTHLIARNCNFDDNFTREELVEHLLKYQPYDFNVDVNVKIAKDDEELAEEKLKEKEYLIPDNKEIVIDYSPEEFEKDDDTNWHIKFITAASNLRCINYGIPNISYDETKGIAGKIVPAVATTTSIVAGLITMELIKYCCGVDDLEKYKSYFVNLATNLVVASEPIKSPMLKFGGVEINSWTKFELNDNLNLEALLELYQEKFKTKISMILHGTTILYADFMPTDVKSLLTDLFKQKFDIDLLKQNAELVLAADDDEIELPTIEIKL